MEFGVGSKEELNYISQLIQKHGNEVNNERTQKDNSIIDFKEYQYLQYLVFKYCFIPNAAL